MADFVSPPLPPRDDLPSSPEKTEGKVNEEILYRHTLEDGSVREGFRVGGGEVHHRTIPAPGTEPAAAVEAAPPEGENWKARRRRERAARFGEGAPKTPESQDQSSGALAEAPAETAAATDSNDINGEPGAE